MSPAKRTHMGDYVPDFGTPGIVPMCRKSGFVIGPQKKRNPLYAECSLDATKVDCKACLKIMAAQVERKLKTGRAWLLFESPAGPEVVINYANPPKTQP